MITDPKIEQYCIDHSTPPDDTQKTLIEATHTTLPQAARMQVGALEGRFLSMITAVSRSSFVLELGTFTGYSSLSFAEAVPAHGKVTTLDVDPKATAIAQDHWNKSPHRKKIELILGPALETLTKLRQEIALGTRPYFDLVFIDADKANYVFYYEAALELIQSGGLILVDNVLWSGAVLDPKDKSDHHIVALNQKVSTDSRVEKVLLPIRDGIYLIRKR